MKMHMCNLDATGTLTAKWLRGLIQTWSACLSTLYTYKRESSLIVSRKSSMFIHQTTAEWAHHQNESCRQRMFPSCMLLLPLNALNYLSTNTQSHLVHAIQSRVNHRIMRFAYLPWFVLGGHTWAEGVDEVTPGPCLAWLGASLCRLADSCFCCVLPCEKA